MQSKNDHKIWENSFHQSHPNDLNFDWAKPKKVIKIIPQEKILEKVSTSNLDIEKLQKTISTLENEIKQLNIKYKQLQKKLNNLTHNQEPL